MTAGLWWIRENCWGDVGEPEKLNRTIAGLLIAVHLHPLERQVFLRIERDVKRHLHDKVKLIYELDQIYARTRPDLNHYARYKRIASDLRTTIYDVVDMLDKASDLLLAA